MIRSVAAWLGRPVSRFVDVRRSTVILALVFVGLILLYLAGRDDSAGTAAVCLFSRPWDGSTGSTSRPDSRGSSTSGC